MAGITSPDLHRSMLGKAVMILRAFTADDDSLTLTQLVQRTGMHKTTTHRLAGELVRIGLLERVQRGYRLGSGLCELGERAAVERGLLEVAMPFLNDLYRRTHGTVHLGVMECRDVIYLAKICDQSQAPTPSRTGGRMPLHCTAIGKALLAHSDPATRQLVLGEPLRRRTPHTIASPALLGRQLLRISSTGIAFDHQEAALGITCVAAAVLDNNLAPIAAISVTGPLPRFQPVDFVPEVRAAAAALSEAIIERGGSLQRDHEQGLD